MTTPGRTLATAATVSALGALLSAGAIAAPALPARDSAPRASSAAAKKKPQPRKRSAARLSVRRGSGTGHVPRSLLGPRWAQIGGGANTSAPAAATTTGPTWTAPAPTATTPTPTTPTDFKALGVATRDGALPWRISPSLITMPAGSYSVQLQNLGEDPHDLKIQREADSVIVASFPQTGPMSGGRPGLANLQVDLGRAGTYVLFCSLPGHWDYGMHTEIEVTG